MYRRVFLLAGALRFLYSIWVIWLLVDDDEYSPWKNLLISNFKKNVVFFGIFVFSKLKILSLTKTNKIYEINGFWPNILTISPKTNNILGSSQTEPTQKVRNSLCLRRSKTFNRLYVKKNCFKIQKFNISCILFSI